MFAEMTVRYVLYKMSFMVSKVEKKPDEIWSGIKKDIINIIKRKKEI